MRWLAEHPTATAADAFEAGYYASTDAWCRWKREKMEHICEMIKEVIW